MAISTSIIQRNCYRNYYVLSYSFIQNKVIRSFPQKCLQSFSTEFNQFGQKPRFPIGERFHRTTVSLNDLIFERIAVVDRGVTVFGENTHKFVLEIMFLHELRNKSM